MNAADEIKDSEVVEEITEEPVESECEVEDTVEPEDVTEGDTEGTEDGEGKKKEKRGLFGKKDKSDKRDEEIADLKDKNMRLFAEFDNFRKRTEKEKSAMFETGAKSIIEKLLPIVDNFERGLATISEEEKETGFANGMDLIYKQLMKMLADLDVVAIPAVGEQFDPNLHNAVMHIDDENLGENVIAQEFQKGYTYRGTVVRHSMVQVAN